MPPSNPADSDVVPARIAPVSRSTHAPFVCCSGYVCDPALYALLHAPRPGPVRRRHRAGPGACSLHHPRLSVHPSTLGRRPSPPVSAVDCPTSPKPVRGMLCACPMWTRKCVLDRQRTAKKETQPLGRKITRKGLVSCNIFIQMKYALMQHVKK